MEKTKDNSRCLMISWFCKILMTFYPRLFKDCHSVDEPYLQRQDQAFQDLKTAFTTAPILIHPNFSKPFFLESDASNYALGAVLSQKGKNKQFHPIVFHSRKFTTVEINYEIYNKEFLVIIDSFQE
jgi:hypothetical protein